MGSGSMGSSSNLDRLSCGLSKGWIIGRTQTSTSEAMLEIMGRMKLCVLIGALLARALLAAPAAL